MDSLMQAIQLRADTCRAYLFIPEFLAVKLTVCEQKL
jgi:hypothetical protein